jgi:hypothetical protein
MASNTHRGLLTQPNYTQRHVGGKFNPVNNKQYIKNQIDLISDADRKVPPNVRYGNHNKVESNPIQDENYHASQQKVNGVGLPYSRPLQKNFTTESNYDPGRQKKDVYLREDYDRYDDYIGYLYNRGLMQDGSQIRRYRTQYININSKFRQILPSLNTEDAIVLDVNPLNFNVNSDIVFINHPNNNFAVGDLITLERVFGTATILRTYSDDGLPTFFIKGGCNVMKVNFRHGLPKGFSGNIEVEFRDIKGDRGTIETSSFLGNIPTNVLNGTHQLKLTVLQTDLLTGCLVTDFPAGYLDYSPTSFFVILPISMQNPSGEAPYVLQEYNFKLFFLSVAGVPLNLLNARYPITPNNLQGYHMITQRFDNGYNIVLSTKASLSLVGGGDGVTVARITAVNTGYPNPNSYIIDLGQIYHDIISVRMISSEFPNSNRVIKDFPLDAANNKIHWNDMDDGDYLYTIAVPPGNYTPDSLVSTLQQLFLDTQRVNAQILGPYDSSHYVQVTINQNTDEVIFGIYKQASVVEPFVQIDPDINPQSQIGQDDPNAIYTVTVQLDNHGLTTVGDQILIQGAINTSGIPASVLNGQQTINSIVNQDQFTIVLPKFNLLSERSDTKGGVAVSIFIPDRFSLRFDFPDTIGGLLGFRNPGNINSVTPFNHFISNQDEYLNDISTNTLGQEINVTNNAIQLSGDNYVFMQAQPLFTLDSIGPVPQSFVKILLCDIPGKVLFNTYVNTSRFYEDPLAELDSLEIEFLTPDGFLYDFFGLDHSFMLEIVTVNDIPEGTGISANTGRNYNITV